MYEAKDYSSLLGTPGFSDNLLDTHFGLYQGYVKNTNTLVEKLASAESGTPEYAELKRRFGWEFNGMRLHELYFSNMIKDGAAPSDTLLATKLTEDFGSIEAWEKDFKASGALRGIGWVVLYKDGGNRLFNVWVNEHDVGHLAGATPLLVMDVFEHAFILDYGMKRGEYIDAFMKSIDWSVVGKRFEK
jgi:superoxide dismutase, Fe-Mn family